MIRATGLGLVLMIVLACTSARAEVFDQQNTPGVYGCYSVFAGTAFGQSFQPTLDRIDFLDLQLCFMGPDNADPVQMVIQLHNGVFGPVIGTSTPVALPAGQDWWQARFTFPGVQLVPGSVYYVSFHQTPGVANWGVGATNGNLYPRGGLYTEIPGWEAFVDAWFREGMFDAVPVRSGTWGSVKAIYR